MIDQIEDLAYGLDLTAADPASLNASLFAAARALARRPAEVANAVGGLALEQAAIGLDVTRTMLAVEQEPVVAPEPGDRRFSDRAWKENAFLRGVMESYLASSRAARRLVDSAEVDERTRRKARFALGAYLDALSPTNVPFLNPTVVKEALDTGGLSLARGFVNAWQDVLTNGGMPRQVDRESFQLGVNTAATPGRIVFRNGLIELIQYEPQTETVFAQPIVYQPAWINKYYIMDLAPGRSFVDHAVKAGFTVFAASYRNPDESMAEHRLDDYFRDGLMTAVGEASRITGSATANVVAVCIGGTLTMMGLGALASRGEADRIGWATVTNTLVDFSEPGNLGVFADEATIERVERRNARRGFVDSSEIASAFTWLRGNDLIWNYVVSNWLMGKQPPAFDILAWNADSTRLPAAMHSQFLRACYLQNALAEPGAFELDGSPVDLSKVENPIYVLTAENDHIAPWRTCYRTTQLVSGPSRHVLATGGHVAGMVNPPGNPKAFYSVNEATPPDPEQWLAGAEKVQGSWWDDWAAWAAERSGERTAPPELAKDGEPAPGQYVRG